VSLDSGRILGHRRECDADDRSGMTVKGGYGRARFPVPHMCCADASLEPNAGTDQCASRPGTWCHSSTARSVYGYLEQRLIRQVPSKF